MIDPSRQLVLRVDLYANYVFLVAIVISICEIPVLMWRLEAGHYIVPLGWSVLLALGIRRMWMVKIDHDLTSRLQVYKIVLISIIISGAGGVAYYFIANIAMMRASRFTEIGLIVSVANGLIGGGVLAAGVLAIWFVDKLAALSRNRFHD